MVACQAIPVSGKPDGNPGLSLMALFSELIDVNCYVLQFVFLQAPIDQTLFV